MTKFEIHEQATALHSQFQELLVKNMFTYVPEMLEIANKLTDIQAQCEHNYVNGVCEYCLQQEQEEDGDK